MNTVDFITLKSITLSISSPTHPLLLITISLSRSHPHNYPSPPPPSPFSFSRLSSMRTTNKLKSRSLIYANVLREDPARPLLAVVPRVPITILDQEKALHLLLQPKNTIIIEHQPHHIKNLLRLLHELLPLPIPVIVGVIVVEVVVVVVLLMCRCCHLPDSLLCHFLSCLRYVINHHYSLITHHSSQSLIKHQSSHHNH